MRKLTDAEQVHLLCAGTRGEITREDVLLAGAIAYGLTLPNNPAMAGAWYRCQFNDQARLARDAWQAARPPAELPFLEAEPIWLLRALLATQGGRNLQAIGLERDIAACAAIDRLNVVATSRCRPLANRSLTDDSAAQILFDPTRADRPQASLRRDGTSVEPRSALVAQTQIAFVRVVSF